MHPKPLRALKAIYGETLTALSALPATSVYRQATESLTNHRLSVVEKAGEDISAVEKELALIVEVALEEATAEHKLVGSMTEWKA